MVAPVPARDRIEVRMPPGSGAGWLVLRNALGAEVRRVAIAENTTAACIDVGALPAGMYGIAFFCEDTRVFVQRILISR